MVMFWEHPIKTHNLLVTSKKAASAGLHEILDQIMEQPITATKNMLLLFKKAPVQQSLEHPVKIQ